MGEQWNGTARTSTIRVLTGSLVIAVLCGTDATRAQDAETRTPAPPSDGRAPAPAASTAAEAQSPPASGLGSWLHPFVIFSINANHNSGGLFPGSWAIFALPDGDQRDFDQFNMSPANTYAGAVFTFPKVGETAISAKVDFNLRGSSPLANQNIFGFQFLDIYLELKNDPVTFTIGQAVDVVSPLIPTNLNDYPLSYVPGSIGFLRPMIRTDVALGVGEHAHLLIQGALAQAIQTFEVSGESRATQAGSPDVQGRGAFAWGKTDPLGQHDNEIGVSGHFGERRLIVSGVEDDVRNTYSFGFDGRVRLASKTKVKGEYYTGQLVGDYMGAIFQTFDPITGTPVDAQGFWLELEQGFREKWVGHVGYGLDNVEEQPGLGELFGRTQNANAYGNVFYKFTPELSFAGEVAWWRTQYKGLPEGSPFRIEVAAVYSWIGK